MNLEKYAHIYFDNNFYALMRSDSGAKINAFNKSCDKYGIVKKEYQPAITWFVFLEAIGFSMKSVSLPQIKSNFDISSIIDLESLHDFKYDIFEQALSYYSSHPNLSKEKILEYVSEQQNRGSDFGKDIFTRTFSKEMLDENFEKGVYWSLAYDYVQKHLKYPKDKKNLLVRSFLDDITRASIHNLNVSQARVIGLIWQKLAEDFLVHKDITKAQQAKIKKYDYCFKTNADLVDTELTHFANIGWLSDNQYHPTICVTCDENIEKIKFRLGVYKVLMINHYRSLRKHSKQHPHGFNFKQGAVVVCSRKTGEIREVIELEKLDTII